ncbi:MAG: hypothetical protein QXP98_07255 [Thermoproteus sp.]
MKPVVGRPGARVLFAFALAAVLAVVRLSPNVHAQITGAPVGIVPAGTYWGFEIGSYSPYANASLPPGNYTVAFNRSTTIYLLISPTPFNFGACHADSCGNGWAPQSAVGFVSTNGEINFTLTEPEYVVVLSTEDNVEFTITRNGRPLSVAAVRNAPNRPNSCGYNGYPIGLQGCGPIYGTLWLTDGMDLFYITGITCTGFGTPSPGEDLLPLTGANTCSGAKMPNTTLIVIPISHIYAITFVESGLPPGARWGVTLNGVTKSSTANSITFTVPPGTYRYKVDAPSGYAAMPSNGIIELGASIVIYVRFTPAASGAGASTVSTAQVISLEVAVVAAAVLWALRRRRS